jgi:predicted RNase H-like HicB family nuclease
VAKLEYPIIIEPLPADEGGGFVAIVPDLPGCMSDGETAEGALEHFPEKWIPVFRKEMRQVSNLERFPATAHPISWSA